MSLAASEEFSRLRERIEKRLGETLPVSLAGQTSLRDAIETSVMAPGKRYALCCPF